MVETYSECDTTVCPWASGLRAQGSGLRRRHHLLALIAIDRKEYRRLALHEVAQGSR